MARLKIAVDCRNLLEVLNALNSHDNDAILEMWYRIKEPGNPAHQLMLEYNAYQELVSAPMPDQKELLQ